MFLHSDFGEWLAVKIHGEAVGAKDGTVIPTHDLFRDHQQEYSIVLYVNCPE
jgi:hypothetical protein